MQRWMVALWCGLATTARAEPAPFVELEVRDDVLHSARLGGGIGVGKLEATLLVDPQGLDDHVFSTDLAVGYRVYRGATLRAIVRETAVVLDGGTRYFDYALLGASMPVRVGMLEVHAGVQVGAQVVARGGDMEAQWFAHRFYTRSLLADLFVEVRFGRVR